MWNHPNSIQIFRAVDFGYFPDPAYCVWLAHLGNRYIAFKEMIWYKTVASDVAKSIVEESDGMRVTATYCDPSMNINTGADIRTIRDIFEENGVPMEPSINNREHYAHAVNTALNEEAEPGLPRLQILRHGCPYLIKSIPQQRYDPKHPMRMADNKNDHPVVALAYFLISNSSMNMAGPIVTKSLPKWMQDKKSDHHPLGHDQIRNR